MRATEGHAQIHQLVLAAPRLEGMSPEFRPKLQKEGVAWLRKENIEV